MASIEPVVLRTLEGLVDRTGRTVVIAGPPASGKSAQLTKLRTGIEALDGRVVTLSGTYRGRSVPWGALEGLERPADAPEALVPDADVGLPEPVGVAPMAPVALAPEALGPSRRRGGRGRTTFLGETARTRGPAAHNVDDYWDRLLPEFEGETGHPVALLVEEAALFDTESREFLLDLSRRARLRPLLIAITLDSTSSAAAVWEEALLGRSDVDWIRLAQPAPDPREVHRLSQLLVDLPPASIRLLGFLVLLGGEAPGVQLARVTNLSLVALRDAAKPAVGVGLIRVREGRLSIPDLASVPVLEGLLPEADRRKWHHEVAEGLQALSAEPPLSRRVEIAHHYLAASADAVAMSRLLETAEISLGLLDYDLATTLLAEALECLRSIPPGERPAIEPEMHLMNARALFCSGCPEEGEAELREGVDGALRAGTNSADLASWLEPVLPTLLLVGPRGRLAPTIVELAERLHDAGLVEPEVLLETLLPAYDAERNLIERSRAEALRAAQSAHQLQERHLQALGLFAMGVARVPGSPEEVLQAERFIRAARFLLKDSRRWWLDYIAGEFECRLLERRGELEQALALRRQSIGALERARLPSVELFHALGIARILLHRGDPTGAEKTLQRARQIAERLHLFPPSPGLLELWLLEGRIAALAGSVAAARDRFSAVADLPATLSLPRLRAEATLRLALLEFGAGRAEAAEKLTGRLAAPELLQALTEPAREWAKDPAAHAAESRRGGGPLPQPPPLPRPPDPERRERRGS